MIPRIDVFKCDGCGACVKRCPVQIMGLIRGKAALLQDLCEECGICAEACPIEAIRFRLPNYGVAATHVNLNDGSVEGIRSDDGAAVGVQFHPIRDEMGCPSKLLVGFMQRLADA